MSRHEGRRKTYNIIAVTQNAENREYTFVYIRYRIMYYYYYSIIYILYNIVAEWRPCVYDCSISILVRVQSNIYNNIIISCATYALLLYYIVSIVNSTNARIVVEP